MEYSDKFSKKKHLIRFLCLFNYTFCTYTYIVSEIWYFKNSRQKLEKKESDQIYKIEQWENAFFCKKYTVQLKFHSNPIFFLTVNNWAKRAEPG